MRLEAQPAPAPEIVLRYEWPTRSGRARRELHVSSCARCWATAVPATIR